jgi:hypothetical protein
MITIIALLGLAVVALQLSSTQFSPRLLRNFLRDRAPGGSQAPVLAAAPRRPARRAVPAVPPEVQFAVPGAGAAL